MFIIGIDPHKGSHTAAVLDDQEELVGELRVVAAVTQIAHDTPGRVYFDRKLAEGKTRKEALRALKRRISDAVYRQLLADARR